LGLLPKKFLQDNLQISFLVICNILEDPMECAHAKGFMTGNGYVVFLSIDDGGKSLVTSGLMIDTIPVPVKKVNKFVAIEVPGQFHTAISSYFTM